MLRITNTYIMKSLNENWFPITLIAVVFGLLGYLIGTNSGKHHCPMMGDMDNHKIFMKKMHGMDSFSWSSDDNIFFSEEGDIEIDIDSIVESNGKKVKVMVKKMKK